MADAQPETMEGGAEVTEQCEVAAPQEEGGATHSTQSPAKEEVDPPLVENEPQNTPQEEEGQRQDEAKEPVEAVEKPPERSTDEAAAKEEGELDPRAQASADDILHGGDLRAVAAEGDDLEGTIVGEGAPTAQPHAQGSTHTGTAQGIGVATQPTPQLASSSAPANLTRQTSETLQRRTSGTSQPVERRTSTGSAEGGSIHVQVTVTKINGAVGINLGGGWPLCPVVYVARLHPEGAAAQQGVLEVGDQLVGVNGRGIVRMTKDQAASIVKDGGDTVVLHYIKFQMPDERRSSYLDGRTVNLKVNTWSLSLSEYLGKDPVAAFKLHEQVEAESEEAQRQLAEYRAMRNIYRSLPKRLAKYAEALHTCLDSQKQLADAIGFGSTGVEDAEVLRVMEHMALTYEKAGTSHEAVQKAVAPFLDDATTFADKAIGDLQLTVDKYKDAKKQYMAISVALREMDAEEQGAISRGEGLDRCAAGNIRYRKYLRLKVQARKHMLSVQDDVRVKRELLDHKLASTLTNRVAAFLAACEHHTNTLASCSQQV